MSVGRSLWKSAFQASPIIFSGGISAFMPAQMLPLSAITEALSFPLGLIGGDRVSGDADNFFASFAPVSGGTLVEQEIARYPFLNQVVAANAVIGQPLHIAMLMICPARNNLGYPLKLAIISALQAAVTLHNNNGGTYIVATPSYIYPNCIFRRMSDVSSGISKQPQSAWLLEFEQPLIALGSGGTVASQSSLLQVMSSLGFIDSSNLAWSGPFSTIQNPSFVGSAATPPLQGVAYGISNGSIQSSPLPNIPGSSVLPQ